MAGTKRLRLSYMKGVFGPIHVAVGDAFQHDGEVYLSNDLQSVSELEYAINGLKAELDAVLAEGKKELSGHRKLFVDKPNG